MAMKPSVNGQSNDGWTWECPLSSSQSIPIPKVVWLQIGNVVFYYNR
jgi:hypothetical protein